MTDKLDLPRRYRDQLEALLREHVPDAEVWAYGSRVTGKSHDGSDLDLVLRSPTLEPFGEDFFGLLEAMEKSNIPILVQAHDWARLPESFHREIEREYVVLQKGKRETDGALPCEWRMCTLGELTDNFDAIRIPVKQSERQPGPYPYYGASGVVDHVDGFLFNGEHLLVAEDGENLRTRTTPIAFIANGKFWVNNHAHIVRGNNHADTRFLQYALSDLDISGYLTGSTMPKLTQGNMNNISLLAPPLPEQQAIAHILGTLDDKIELNRRMNQTLEEMARTIFQDWFVDFGPVHAKLEGREPYLPPELWDLFPDRLVDSELGEIPEGWGVKALSDCIEVERGLSYKGSGLSSDGVPMHNLNSVYEGGGYKDHGIKYYSGDFQARHVAQPGDVVVANTEQGHDRLLIGFAAVLPQRFGDNGLFSHHLYRVRSQSGSGLSADFVCHLLNTQAMHDAVSGYATGTTVNMLPVDALRIPPTVIPPAQVLTTFSTISETARMRQEFLVTECQRLAAQRDVLLPKLMSGKVCIKDGTGSLDAGKR